MDIQIQQIEYGTTFSILSKKYVLNCTNWSTSAPTFDTQKLIGSGSDTQIIQCHPILGGREQTKIDLYIRKDAIVTIE